MIERAELYRLVWCEPMTKVSERFGVSGIYLARICTILNVPRPERGYWAKLAVGKAPPQKALPTARPGDPVQWEKGAEPVALSRSEPPVPRKPAASIRVSRSRVHELVRGAKSHFEGGRPVEEDSYLRPYKRLLVDVTASQAALEKALGLANDLFNALESAGCRVTIPRRDGEFIRIPLEEREVAKTRREGWYHGQSWSPQRPTVAFAGTVAIGIQIVEMSENVELRYVNGRYVRESEYVPPSRSRHVDYTWTTRKDVPSGRLRIIAYSPYNRVDWSTHWQETRKSSLESSLRAVVRTIKAAALDLAAKLETAEREAQIRHQQWLDEQERRQREDDGKRVEQSVTDSRSALQEVIAQWSEAMNVERFLEDVDRRAAELPDGEQHAVSERLRLARELLGSTNPLDFLRQWKSPGERYVSKYPEEDTGDAASLGVSS